MSVGYFVIKSCCDTHLSNDSVFYEFYKDPYELLKLHLCGLYFDDYENTIFSVLPENIGSIFLKMKSEFDEQIRYKGLCGFLAYAGNQNLDPFVKWYNEEILPLTRTAFSSEYTMPELLQYCIKSVIINTTFEQQFVDKCNTMTQVAWLLPCEKLADGTQKYLLPDAHMRITEKWLKSSSISGYDDFVEAVKLLASQFLMEPKLLQDLLECYVANRITIKKCDFISYGDYMRGVLK